MKPFSDVNAVLFLFPFLCIKVQVPFNEVFMMFYAFFLLFNKWSTSIIPSIIGTIKIMNADDRSDKVKKLASVVAKYKPSTKDKAERMVNLEEKLTKLEQEG